MAGAASVPPLKSSAGSRAGGRGAWGSLAHTVLARWGIARFATEVAQGKPLLARSCLSVKAAFVQPLRKALTRPPALSCSHKTEEGQSALEQPLPERAAFIRSFLQSKSLRRGAQQPRAHLRQGSVLCLRTPRAAGDPGRTASSARCRQGCPNPIWEVLAGQIQLGSTHRSRGAGRGGAVSHLAAQQPGWCRWQSSKRHRAIPRVVRGLRLRGKKPSHG